MPTAKSIPSYLDFFSKESMVKNFAQSLFRLLLINAPSIDQANINIDLALIAILLKKNQQNTI